VAETLERKGLRARNGRTFAPAQVARKGLDFINLVT
jgi:hypothetical protein